MALRRLSRSRVVSFAAVAIASFLFSTAPSRAAYVLVSLSADGLDLEDAELVVLDDAGTVTLVLPLPSNSSVRVDVENADFVSCRGRTIWCPRVSVTFDGEPDFHSEDEAAEVRAIRVPAYSRAQVLLPVQVPRGDAVVDEQFRVEGWMNGASPALHFVEPAVWDGRYLRWDGPVGPSDYRVAGNGWAPVYLFDVGVVAGVNELEERPLTRGASLSVSIHEQESGFPVPGAQVSASPVGSPQDQGTARIAVRGVSDVFLAPDRVRAGRLFRFRRSGEGFLRSRRLA